MTGLFPMSIHAKNKRNGPPGSEQGPSTAHPRLHNALQHTKKCCSNTKLLSLMKSAHADRIEWGGSLGTIYNLWRLTCSR